MSEIKKKIFLSGGKMRGSTHYVPPPAAPKIVESDENVEVKKSVWSHSYNFDDSGYQKRVSEINKKFSKPINAAAPVAPDQTEKVSNKIVPHLDDLLEFDNFEKVEMMDDNPYEFKMKKSVPVPAEKPRNVQPCHFCKKEIELDVAPSYNFRLNRRTNGFCCNDCRPTLFQCKCCEGLFKDSGELTENHCSTCIEGIPKNTRYLQPYQNKAEGVFDSTVTSRKENLKFHSESAREIFGAHDYRSFTIGAAGVALKLFGVELEYETKNNWGLGILSAVNVIKESGLQAIVKRDSTLKAGFEIVSCPADKNYHNYAWERFFDKIERDENIYCADYQPPVDGAEKGTGTGCHIHISKDGMIHESGRYGLAGAKLQTFFHHPKNRKFIEIIGGRPSNMFSDFTAKKGLQVKGGKIVSGADEMKKLKNMDHRTAVNFNTSNGKTIEFRIFRSTKDRDELKKNIDFVDAICHFCRPGISSISDVTDWSYFTDFVCKNAQDYPSLYRFLSNDSDFARLCKR